MEEIVKGEQEKECTFQPERKERSAEPSFGDFIKKQQEHIKRKVQYCLDKQKEKEEGELNKLQNKPNISDCSKNIAKNKGSTYERLLGKKLKLIAQSPAREKAELRAGTKEVPPVATLSLLNRLFTH